MKHNPNHGNAPAHRVPDPQRVRIRFDFKDPKATIVLCFAGTFNHWQPDSETLHSSGISPWWNATTLAPDSHEYGFVVDGQWAANLHTSTPAV